MRRSLSVPLVVVLPALAAPDAAQCDWQQSDQLAPQASAVAAAQHFGRSLAMHGSTALVGAPGVSPASPTAGSAFVFERLAGKWVQVAELADADGRPGDDLGRSVALSLAPPHHLALLGAPKKDDGRGAALLFSWTGTAWTEAAELVPRGAAAGASAGASVALAGDVALVGAPGEERVVVFEPLAGGWTETGTLAPPARTPGFGAALAFDGTYAAVGAPGAGAVLVFERAAPGLAWMQAAVLTAPAGAPRGDFGTSVALSGDRLVVGAPGDSGGAAFVYREAGGVWVLEQELAPPRAPIPGSSGPASAAGFGRAVAIEREEVVVGAPGDGTAHVFERSASGTWRRTAELAPQLAPEQGQFGSCVAVAAGRVMVNVGLDEAGLFGAAVTNAYAGAVFVWSSGGYVAPLAGFPAQVSLGAGGGQLLYLDAGASQAAAPYLVLGSASGTSPGYAGLPLNLDAYLLFTLLSPNTLVQGSLGLLDGCGRGTALLLLPPATDAALAGATLHHAFVVLEPAGGPPALVSNPAPVSLVP